MTHKTFFSKFTALVLGAVTIGAIYAMPVSAMVTYELKAYFGDVNADMQVNTADAVLLAQYLAGEDVAIPQTDAYYIDMDKNGSVNAVDLVLLKQQLLSGTEPQGDYDEVIVEDVLMEAPVKAVKPSLPSTGTDRILLFMIDCPDCKHGEQYTAEYVQNIAFGPEDKNSIFYPLESISAYYERASYGNLHIEGETYYYQATSNVETYMDNPKQLVEEVLSAFDAQIDYHRFDVDNNGVLDTIILALADHNAWWPYSNVYNGRQTYDGIKPGNMLVGGWELRDVAGFVKTWIHEMGHGMGLPDYYKYENYEEGDNYGMNGSAGWAMMDDGFGDMTCFDKLMYGWYTEEQVQVYQGGTQEFQLQCSQDAPSCLMIPRYDDGGYLSEYFLVEYANDTKNNTDDFIFRYWGSDLKYPMFSGGGIRILHCCADVVEGRRGTEFKYNNYGMYYDVSNERQRVLRLVNDGNGFFKSGDIVNAGVSGFDWYDRDGYTTVDPHIQIAVNALTDGVYSVTVSPN